MRMTLVRPTSFNGLSTVVPHEESVSRSSSTITLGPFSTPPPSPCHISESSSISSFADHFLPHFSTEDKDWSAFAYLLDTVELPDMQTEDEEEEGGLRLEIHEPSLPPTSPSGSTATHASPSPTVSPSPPSPTVSPPSPPATVTPSSPSECEGSCVVNGVRCSTRLNRLCEKRRSSLSKDSQPLLQTKAKRARKQGH